MSDTATPFGSIFTNPFGEHYFPAINGETFSKIGSENYFQRHFGGMVDRKDSLNLIPGTDGGLLVNWIAKKKTGEGSRFLFIEYPELLERLYDEELLPRQLPDHVVVATPDEWMKKAEELSLKDYFYIGNVRPWRSMAVIDGFHEGYVKLWNDFDERLGQFQIAVGQELGSRIFMLKCLENLAENRTPVHILDQVFKGRTAVLLGGGPSLDESFAWVRKNRDRLVVMAVARIAVQLARERIVPDMFFAIDPHEIIFHQSKQILDFHERSLLVNMYHLNPRLMGLWRGRSLFMGTLFPWFSEHNPLPRHYPGITVSHQALGSAVEMGFSRIILAGLDLCFSREGFTHARGSVEMATGPYVHRSELWVETNGGWRAETSSDFFNAIPALQSLAEYAKSKECEVINPAAAAAKIEGVAFRSWDELECSQVDLGAWEVIEQTLPVETSRDRMNHYQLVEGELMRLREEVRVVRKLTAEAIDCNDRLFGRRGKPPDFKFKKRMDEIETILDTEHNEVSRLVKKWSVADLLKLSRPDKSREWSDEEIETTGRRYYEVYRDSATNLLKTIDDNRARIQTRMEEEKPSPNIKRILEQYEKDGQEGRVAIFLARRGEALVDFPEKIRKRLESCQEAFVALMQQTEHDYKNHCKNRLASPRAIRSKVMAMFQNNEMERLQHFMEGIGQGDMEEKGQFILLIRGLLAEKKADYDEALKWYRQISFEPLLLEGWQRQLTIYLRQKELVSACAVAKRLAENSLIHFPFYAELLRLTGDTAKALGVYRDYTSVVRDDFVTMIKMGNLLLAERDWEGVRKCCRKILDKDEGHMGARLLLEKVEQGVPGSA
ncbi:MAG: DUF115 domain-containing protein [Magnetococcales bacterium]|nr:DUF115 domain-containing protein [Magnetococcales bacterium]MBF0150294.1 DUF115 domain-containing protein [Magnetococcales bacterium]MBF0629581.1 DUF115 domain-containing protein [Magnetococcales bacterium]